MVDNNAVTREISRRLESEPRIDFAHQAITVIFAQGELLLSGEVSDISVKRVAVKRASEVPGVTTMRDELRLRPAEILVAGEIRDLLHKSLAEDPALAGCALRERVTGGFRTTRAPEVEVGHIDVSIARGVVTLEGSVPSLAQKRLAEALAWWVPGAVNVVANLSVEPPEADTDDALAGSLRLVLERDTTVHASGIRVAASGGVISLEGTVESEDARAAAERDAWFLSGVEDVVNGLTVQASGR